MDITDVSKDAVIRTGNLAQTMHFTKMVHAKLKYSHFVTGVDLKYGQRKTDFIVQISRSLQD